MDWPEAVTQWLHIFFGIFWFGGVLYLNFVLAPQLLTMPADRVREFMVPLARRSEMMFVPAALITIALGFVRGIAFGDIGSLDAVFSTGYGQLWLTALVAAIFTAAWGTYTGRAIRASVAAGDDPTQVARIARRNLVFEMAGFLVVFTCMILMHFAAEA